MSRRPTPEELLVRGLRLRRFYRVLVVINGILALLVVLGGGSVWFPLILFVTLWALLGAVSWATEQQRKECERRQWLRDRGFIVL